MSIIAEVPAGIRKLLEANPEQEVALLEWVSQLHYTQVVLQAGNDDRLVRIKQRFDFRALVQACAGYRLYAGEQGVEAEHTVQQLCYALILRMVEQWSYSKVAGEVRTNSLLRWFVGYRLDQRVFCAVTLWRFEQWLKVQHPHLLFNEIIQQIEQDFPAERQSLQIGDTFALLARAHTQSRTELLRHASSKLLFYLERVTLLGYQQVLLGLSGELLFGKVDETPEQWLEKAARDAVEERTALAASRLYERVQAALAGVRPSRDISYLVLQRWLGVLNKILQDEFTFGKDEEGVVCQATLRVKHEKGSFVIGSTVDPEATFRQHGEKSQLGYNINVAATPHFIREINAVTGATPDSQGVAGLITAQKEQLGVVPPKLIYDRAAGSPKIFHDVAKASDGKTQLVARLIDQAKNSERYGPLDFTLNQDGSLTCPNGQTTHTFYRAGGGDGYNYRFSAKQCQACPLWNHCRGETQLPATPPNAAIAPSAVATAQPVAPSAVATAQPVAPSTVATAQPVAPSTAATAQPVAPSTAATAKTSKRKLPKPDAYRQVFISHYRDQQRSAILYTKTAQFTLDMQMRSQIERIIAGLVRYNGARHATGDGLLNADYQVRNSAIAFNLKAWHKLTLTKEQAQRYTPPDLT